MAKSKVYAVRKGKKTGLFYSWEDCKASVHGFQGAVYKSFLTEEEANAYLNGDSSAEDADKTAQDSKGANGLSLQNQIIAYVDGSFDKSIGKYAFGCVIITPDGEIIRESGSGNNPESLAIRNVAGEMLGAMHAVKWSIENGYSAVKIFYDYMGIEMWATGGWQAKNALTQKYAAYMQKCNHKIAISFQKVMAHTGDKYNEEADKLAKAALLKKDEISEGKQDVKKLAVIFPGIGYHTDKPLLYYSKKLAAANGFEIVDVAYGNFPKDVKDSAEKMEAAYHSALNQSEELLQNVHFQEYGKIVFISKSIGTAVAASYAAEHNLQTCNIFYTPVEASLAFMTQPGIVFHGTNDNWVDSEKLVSQCKQKGYEVFITKDANHSLETGNVVTDIKNMEKIMKETEKYIRKI